MKYVHVHQEAQDRAMVAYEQAATAKAIDAFEPAQTSEVNQ